MTQTAQGRVRPNTKEGQTRQHDTSAIASDAGKNEDSAMLSSLHPEYSYDCTPLNSVRVLNCEAHGIKSVHIAPGWKNACTIAKKITCN